MKSLQEQLDFAHQEFTAYEVYFAHLQDEVGLDTHIVEAEYYIEQMEMWLSIINSLTQLLVEDNDKIIKRARHRHGWVEDEPMDGGWSGGYSRERECIGCGKKQIRNSALGRWR